MPQSNNDLVLRGGVTFEVLSLLSVCSMSAVGTMALISSLCDANHVMLWSGNGVLLHAMRVF